MRAKNNAGQQRLGLQRVLVILCVFLLFISVGIVLSLSSEVYAHNTVIEHRLTTNVACTTNTPIIPTPTPTNTPIVPTPTDTPIVPTPTPTDTPIVPTPTDTPIIATPTDTPIVPTPTDTPIIPTPTPTDTPIVPTPTVISTPTTTATTTQITANKNLLSEHVQVVLPCDTPTTTVAKPTSTSAAGVLPPVGTSTVTQKGTPTPTPSPASMTATPSRSGLPPTSTDIVPTPTPNGYSTAATGQNNGKLLLPSIPELAIGSSVLGAAAVVGWFVWRRRQGLSSTGLAQTQPAYNSSQVAQAAFAAGNAGMVRENRAFYQEGTTAQALTHMPETPLPHQAIMDTLEPSLETIMRQARTGLFALPDKEVYS